MDFVRKIVGRRKRVVVSSNIPAMMKIMADFGRELRKDVVVGRCEEVSSGVDDGDAVMGVYG